jgi:ADP-heptose:LPS heptosyltransferase
MQQFVQTMRARRFDLLVQMHGSGSVVNPLMALCGARRIAGFVEPGGECADPDLHVPWPLQGHESHRLLALTDHLDAPRRGAHLEFPIAEADRALLVRLWPAFSDINRRYVCVHAGAQLPSREWLPARFAAVADALGLEGHAVVLTGTSGEAARANEIERAMRAPVTNLVGRTSLWTLGALLERAALLVSNDTGVVHVAAALGTPSVAVSSGGDVGRWAPANRLRHQVLWAPTPCRPCQHRVCPYDHECATAVGVRPVARAALRALRLADR